MGVLKKLKAYTLSVSILYIIVGMIMLLNPKFICDAVNYIIGSLILLYGIIYLIGLYQQKNYELLNKFNFLAGIMCISFGIFLILNSNILVSLIPFCGGVIIFIDSIYQIKNSINLKKLNSKYWWINLIIGLLFLGFAVFIVINASNVTHLIIQIIGCVLVLDGIMDFYTYLSFRKYNREIKVINE